MQWCSESLKKRATALLRTCPLRMQSRNCRTLHATRQRYSLQAIEDNGGLSTLRGTLSWLDMSPVASGIQAAISRSCQPPRTNRPDHLSSTSYSSKQQRLKKANVCSPQPAFSRIDKKVRSLFELFCLKTIIFHRCINLCPFLILICNIFKFFCIRIVIWDLDLFKL